MKFVLSTFIPELVEYRAGAFVFRDCGTKILVYTEPHMSAEREKGKRLEVIA